MSLTKDSSAYVDWLDKFLIPQIYRISLFLSNLKLTLFKNLNQNHGQK